MMNADNCEDLIEFCLLHKDNIVCEGELASCAKLDLSGVGLGDKGVIALAIALRSMKKLEWLSLEDNQFGVNGASALAPVLEELGDLKHLNLGHDCSKVRIIRNEIGVRGASALAPALENMGSLQQLNFRSCSLGADGARALAPALEKMSSLYLLDLSGNSLGAAGIRALTPAFKKMSSLQQLNIRDSSLCADAGRAFVPAFVEMGSLRDLDFFSNFDLEDLKLTELQRKFINLYSVHHQKENFDRKLELPQWGFSRIPDIIFRFESLELLMVSKMNRGVFNKLSKISGDERSNMCMGRNVIKFLPSDIGKLTALRRLEVIGGKIDTLPSSIGRLRLMKYLDLRHNPLAGLPDGRGILVENRNLDLSNRGMVEIPIWVWRLRWIRALSFSRNPLAPSVSFAKLSRFENLTSLDLSHLCLSSLSHIPLSSLSLLSTLDLTGNSLISFPGVLMNLPSLSSLNLSQNPLSMIPPDFLASSALKTLNLLPCKSLTSPPPSIAKLGLQGMRTYFEELQKGSQFLVHMKLLLLGDAEMGKTTLFEALTTGKGKSGWRPRTFGIDVRFWDIAHLRKSTSGFFSVWDFAGQEDYVAAHSLFVGEAVVLLVVRLDAEPPFMKYLARWLDSLCASVKSKTPFLVIGTHSDRLWSSQKDTALSRLRSELLAYGYEVGGERQGNLELLDILALSSTKVRGIPDLRERLVDLASDRYCELYPTSYWDLHSAVREASKHQPIVKWTQFWRQAQLVLPSSSAEEETVLQMTKVLHEWGSVLFFEEMEERYVVLNPQWLAKCVAKVVSSDEFVNAEGVLHTRTWMEHGPRPAHFLLSLLQRFGIVCALNMESCLVPCRLKSSRPRDFQIRWPTEIPSGLESRRLFYRFERAAPRGFFSHLMARCLSRPEHYDSIYWDRGLVTRDGSSGCMACVLSEPFQVVLKVRGRGDSLEELLRWLVSTIELFIRKCFP